MVPAVGDAQGRRLRVVSGAGSWSPSPLYFGVPAVPREPSAVHRAVGNFPCIAWGSWGCFPSLWGEPGPLQGCVRSPDCCWICFQHSPVFLVGLGQGPRAWSGEIEFPWGWGEPAGIILSAALSPVTCLMAPLVCTKALHLYFALPQSPAFAL